MSSNITVTTKQAVKQTLARELSQKEALELVGPAEYAARSGKGRLLTMMVALGKISLDASGGKAPDRVKLFAYGETGTTKGTFFLSQDSSARVMTAQAEYGNDLVVDLDHRSLWGDTKAVGWFSCEVDGEGLWAGKPLNFLGEPSPTGVMWLAEGIALIESYQYRYISPVFWTEYDDQGRELIVEVINFALTNMPATKNRTPLLNSRGATEESNSMSGNQTNITVTTKDELLAQVYALTGQTDADKAKAALIALSQLRDQLTACNASLEQERAAHVLTRNKLRGIELDALIKEGKLAPALREKCLNMSDEQLSVVLSITAGNPALPANQQQVSQPAVTTPASPVSNGRDLTDEQVEAAVKALTKDEKEHCKRYGLDAKEFVKVKAQQNPGNKKEIDFSAPSA